MNEQRHVGTVVVLRSMKYTRVSFEGRMVEQDRESYTHARVLIHTGTGIMHNYITTYIS